MELTDSLKRFLLEGPDPSVRFRVLTDLLGKGLQDPEVVRAREEIGRTGWAAKILELQQSGGHWETFHENGAELYVPKYIATNWRLIVLSDLGMSVTDPRIVRATDLLFKYWETEKESTFGGEDSELCVTGNLVRMMTRLGLGEDPRILRSIDWLVKTQKPDGGWHCSLKSETGTLDCWEALAAFAAIPLSKRSEGVKRAIERGAEFYLERGLLTEIDGSSYPPWHRIHYPTHYYYDILVGLDALTALGYGGDYRLRPALEELLSRRHPDGTWSLDASHPDLMPDDPYHPDTPLYPFVLEYPGLPSRWATFLALRVLARVESQTQAK